MQFKLSSGLLSAQLQLLSKVLVSKNSIAVLDGFLFEVGTDALTITAGDGENVVKSIVPISDCDAQGSFVILASTILDAMRALPDQPVEFAVDIEALNIEINYLNGVYHFPVMSAESYPQPSAVSDGAITLTIDSELLARCLSRSLFAVGKEELRPVMNGIYFDLKEDCLTIVSSNGHILVQTNLPALHTSAPTSFNLPSKPASILKTILDKCAGDVVIKFLDNCAEMSYEGGLMSCRLIEGRYPRYSSVIPQNNPNELTIDRLSLYGAVKRVTPFSRDGNPVIRVMLGEGKAILSAQSIEFDTSAKETVMCDYAGAPMTIGFMGDALAEVLANIDTGEVKMLLADPSRAGIVTPATQTEGEDVLMLIMPMILND